MRGAQYVWTFVWDCQVERSAETHASIERRLMKYPNATDADREEVIAFMRNSEENQTPTFCVFPEFSTILFYMPGVL